MFFDNKGKVSLMRLGVFVVLCLGCIVVLSGLIGWLFLNKADALAMTGLGATSFLSLFAKSFQSFAERGKNE
jgi:hypothetical protein